MSDDDTRDDDDESTATNLFDATPVDDTRDDDDESTATNLFDATPVDDTEHTVDDVRRVAVTDDGSVLRGEPFEPLPVDGDDADLAAVAWEHKLPDGGSD